MTFTFLPGLPRPRPRPGPRPEGTVPIQTSLSCRRSVTPSPRLRASIAGNIARMLTFAMATATATATAAVTSASPTPSRPSHSGTGMKRLRARKPVGVVATLSPLLRNQIRGAG